MPAVELSSLISETLASPRMDAQDLETDGEVCCLSLPMEVPDYDFYTEEINVDSLERWLSVQGVREVTGLFAELYSLRQRVLGVRPDGSASLPVTSYSAPSMTDLRPRAITGIYVQKPVCDETEPLRKKARGADIQRPQVAGALPACALAEIKRGIPCVWAGRGLGSLSWEATLIALPQSTHRLALAHPAISLLGACARAAQVDLPPLLRQCVTDPTVLTSATRQLGVPVNDAEKFLEAVLFGASSRHLLHKSGASPSQRALETMYAFEIEVKRLHKLIYEDLLSDAQRAWLAAHTQQPRAMAFHLLYNNCYRTCVDRMQTALQGDVLHCRGTCCLVRATSAQLPELVSKLQKALPALQFEATGVGSVETALSTRFPDVDFAATADVEWEQYGAAHWACCEALISTKPHSRMTDLSAYLAMCLKSEINLPAEHHDAKFERFVDGAWDTRDIKHLAGPIEAALRSLIPTGTVVEYDLPLLLSCFIPHPRVTFTSRKCTRLSSQLVEPTVARLSRGTRLVPLDGDASRKKLLFSCGQVYDFQTGQVEQLRASHRMKLTAAMRFEPWSPPGNLPDMFSLVGRWLPKVDEQLESDELGREIIAAFEQISQHSPLIKLMHEIFLDWNYVLCLCRVISAVFSADARYCMLHYFVGSGGSAKDTLLLILFTALGEELATTLTSKYATSKAGGSVLSPLCSWYEGCVEPGRARPKRESVPASLQRGALD